MLSERPQQQWEVNFTYMPHKVTGPNREKNAGEQGVKTCYNSRLTVVLFFSSGEDAYRSIVLKLERMMRLSSFYISLQFSFLFLFLIFCLPTFMENDRTQYHMTNSPTAYC